MLAFETDCHIFDGCGFPAPGLHSFMFEPICHASAASTSTSRCCWRCWASIVVVGFFWAAFRKPKLVPGKLQMVGEAGYDFVRRGIVYETIGKKEGEKYVPLMVSLFFFVWMMNLWSIIPVAQFPVTSIIAFPAGLAADRLRPVDVSLTFKRHGFVGGFKNITGYDKSLGPVLPLVVVHRVLLEPARPAVHPRGPALREHVRRSHCCC